MLTHIETCCACRINLSLELEWMLILGVLYNLLFPFKDSLSVLAIHFWFSSVLVELFFGPIYMFEIVWCGFCCCYLFVWIFLRYLIILMSFAFNPRRI